MRVFGPSFFMLKYPDLRDHLYTTKLLDDHLCDTIVSRLDKKKWKDHKWYDAELKQDFEESDFKTLKDDLAASKIYPMIRQLCIEHHDKYHNSNQTNSDLFWSISSNLKFNKYSVGDSIKPHHDHIHDMFDGSLRGIPVVSIIGVLNDDYAGGELLFWNDHEVKLKKGEVVVFPSVYLYPHQVTTVTEGTRYSWVAWCV